MFGDLSAYNGWLYEWLQRYNAERLHRGIALPIARDIPADHYGDPGRVYSADRSP